MTALLVFLSVLSVSTNSAADTRSGDGDVSAETTEPVYKLHCLTARGYVGEESGPQGYDRVTDYSANGIGHAKSVSQSLGYDPGPTGGGSSCSFPSEKARRKLAVNLGYQRRKNGKNPWKWCYKVPWVRNQGDRWTLDLLAKSGPDRPLCGKGDYRTRAGANMRVAGYWIGPQLGWSPPHWFQ